MRHIASLLLGLVIAPLAWILIGAATIGLDPHGLYKEAVGKPNNVVAMAMFALAGIALGVLAVTRLSPAGPVTAAVIFGGLFAFFRFVAKDFTLPDLLEGVKVPTESATAAGESGVVLAVAALLAVAILMPSRWRGPDTDADRVVDTSELSSKPRTDTNRNTDAVDPFAPAFTDSERASTGGGGTTNFPSVGTGFDERPTDPFGGSGSRQPAVPEQRSPYADDAYGGQPYGDNGYDQRQSGGYQQQQQSQYGYGNEQQYR
ncbi:hypothetical protein [Stackebrandtia nassauensis]|uniref:Uncharacterized protein n=1 Tax=Stackebrandtia nassauensis (strain DSM 44728 / CIP 108903 / NRRL B-16338 / NBRC 102104 / LLR-40K-21) TaxID=446470 RepID=D3Q164_STANL|nr:hypothetical protein [Stackebrandtia nassauensis]ADD45644.1 hypothetical protein Snas_6019 [Stackebrandtia nassauensis DSM 44728]